MHDIADIATITTSFSSTFYGGYRDVIEVSGTAWEAAVCELPKTIVGKLEATIVKNIDKNHFKYVFDCFDMMGREMGSIHKDVFTKKHTLRKCLQDSRNIVVINKLIVEPAFRGTGIGTNLLYDFIEMVCPHASAVVLKPYPIHVPRKKYVPQKEIDRLINYYLTLGFKRIQGTTKMYFLPDYAGFMENLRTASGVKGDWIWWSC